MNYCDVWHLHHSKLNWKHELSEKIADAVVDAMQCIVPEDTTKSPVDLKYG